MWDFTQWVNCSFEEPIKLQSPGLKSRGLDPGQEKKKTPGWPYHTFGRDPRCGILRRGTKVTPQERNQMQIFYAFSSLSPPFWTCGRRVSEKKGRGIVQTNVQSRTCSKYHNRPEGLWHLDTEHLLEWHRLTQFLNSDLVFLFHLSSVQNSFGNMTGDCKREHAPPPKKREREGRCWKRRKIHWLEFIKE